MKSRSLSFKAYAEIRKKILSLQIVQGTRLKEDDWASKLKVSRVAIRAALTRLLGEQLVVAGPKGGYFVTSLSPEDITEIRELREILEIGAVRAICPNVSRDQLQQLEKICNDYMAMVNQGYLSGANEADLKFHETLIGFTGNKKLVKSYINNHIPLFHHNLTRSSNSVEDFIQTDKEHRAVLEALKKKNLKLAEKRLRLHFSRGALLRSEW